MNEAETHAGLIDPLLGSAGGGIVEGGRIWLLIGRSRHWGLLDATAAIWQIAGVSSGE